MIQIIPIKYNGLRKVKSNVSNIIHFMDNGNLYCNNYSWKGGQKYSKHTKDITCKTCISLLIRKELKKA